mgnify:CR=1 FL=1
MRFFSGSATVILTLSINVSKAENTPIDEVLHMEKAFASDVDFSNMTAMTNVTALNGTVIAQDEKEIRETPSGILFLLELMRSQSFPNISFENDSLWEGNHNENEKGAISITAVRQAIVLEAKAKQLKTLLSNCFIDGELNHKKYKVARAEYEMLTDELQNLVLSETERRYLDQIMLHIHISILFSDMHANRVDKQHHGQHRSCIEAS